MTNKKFIKDEALAKIKALISNFYENVGRDEIEEIEITKQELIDDIEDILNNTDISSKHLIMERFQLDKLNREKDE